MFLLWIIIPLFLVYTILIIYYWRSWESVPLFQKPDILPGTRISVIIPARNEEYRIGFLLAALEKQSYPSDLFEVIVVDDHSEDRTSEITRKFAKVKLLLLEADNINSYKKKALETGISHATGELIVTIDADCIPGPDWLTTIASFKEKKHASFIASPVVIQCNSSVVQVFQAMDFMVLQGITGAVVHKRILSMCNGANLAYEKKIFEEVNGFDSIDQIASGDDMLLMHKIWKKRPDGIAYLKSADAIVETQAVSSWKEFFNQRIRWASKATQYNDKRVLPVLIVVYLLNFSFFLLLIAGFWKYEYWLAALILLLLKAAIELPFFISVSRFFNKQWAVKWFVLFQPLHIIYTIVSGLFGQFGKYEWKGRRVR